MRVWTIGHSTRTAEAFLALLREHGIEAVADIRRFPTSRWEQFRQPNLRGHLAQAGIEYVHLAELGGYRPGGYEAHARTPEFAAGLERLLALATGKRVAIMCAEAVFFRCHRRFVANALVGRGVEVLHIVRPGKLHRHLARERLDRRAERVPQVTARVPPRKTVRPPHGRPPSSRRDTKTPRPRGRRARRTAFRCPQSPSRTGR